MFVFRKIWRALLSSYLRFEICSFHCITKKNIPSLQPLPLIFLLQHNVLICDPSHHKHDKLCAQITFVLRVTVLQIEDWIRTTILFEEDESIKQGIQLLRISTKLQSFSHEADPHTKEWLPPPNASFITHSLTPPPPLNSLSFPVLIVSAENVTEYFSSNETLCLIRYCLYNLQTIEKHPLKSITFSNVAKVTLSMGVFHVF